MLVDAKNVVIGVEENNPIVLRYFKCLYFFFKLKYYYLLK